VQARADWVVVWNEGYLRGEKKPEWDQDDPNPGESYDNPMDNPAFTWASKLLVESEWSQQQPIILACIIVAEARERLVETAKLR
jgi:hypothetical protein